MRKQGTCKINFSYQGVNRGPIFYLLGEIGPYSSHVELRQYGFNAHHYKTVPSRVFSGSTSFVSNSKICEVWDNLLMQVVSGTERRAGKGRGSPCWGDFHSSPF